MDNIIITIARQYGSGGKTIGAMLARDLGINCYSREILKMASEESGINERLFGQAAGTGVFVLIVVSCLGVLNGLMLACCRGMYAIAVRGEGPRPELFAQVDPVTHMPVNSSVLGLALCGFWLLYFYGANLTESSWFGPFTFDTSEIPIITLYAFYIPIFFQILRRERDLGFVRRVLTPVLALCGCVFMVYAAFAAHGAAVWYYLVVFGAVMLLGAYFGRKSKDR